MHWVQNDLKQYIHHLQSPFIGKSSAKVLPKKINPFCEAEAGRKIIAWKILIFITSFMIESERCKLIRRSLFKRRKKKSQPERAPGK